MGRSSARISGRSALVTLVFALAWVLGERRAEGADLSHPTVESAHLDYRSSVDCPREAQFVAAVAARTEKVRWVASSEAERLFVVTLQERDGGFVGKLTIHRGEDTATREVAGATCAAVTSALALVTALAIDPTASSRGSTAALPPSEAPLENPTPQEETREKERPALIPVPPRANADAALLPVAAKNSEPSNPARPWSFRVIARGEMGAFVAPKAAWGAGAALDLIPPRRAGSGFDLFGLRVGAHYAATGSVERDTGAARFQWAALRAEGCLLRVRLAAQASLDFCSGIDAGFLRGRGEVSAAQTSTPPWLSAGEAARIQWNFNRNWFVELEGSVQIALRRETFIFEEPRQELYEVPLAGPAAAFGVGYAFGDRAPHLRP